MKAEYELTVGGRLGPVPKDSKEISLVNRVVRWMPRGIEYEADPRQVEKLLREIELEGANCAVKPGVKTRLICLSVIYALPSFGDSCELPRR